MRSGSNPASSSGRCQLTTFRGNRGRCLTLRVRAMRDIETDRRPLVPNAPPLRESAPPPPPPPSNSDLEGSDWKPSRRTLFGVLFAGGFGMYALQKTVLSDAPAVLRGKDGKGFFVKTDRGNVLRVFADREGRLWFLDKAGNFYYDSDVPGAGFYAYTRDGNIFNLYEDDEGNPASRFVGTVKDLAVLDTKELGRVYAFQDGRQLPLPPGAYTVEIDPKTNQARKVVPPVLEEGYLALERRGNLLESLMPGKGEVTLESFKRGEPLF